MEQKCVENPDKFSSLPQHYWRWKRNPVYFTHGVLELA